MENIRNMVGDCGRGLLMLVTRFEQCGPNPAAKRMRWVVTSLVSLVCDVVGWSLRHTGHALVNA